MIRKLMIIGLVLGLSGCSMSEPQTTEVDNGKIAVDPINKLQSAANVKVDGEYDFAYNDTVIEDYVTYSNKNSITITASDDVLFTLYGSENEIQDINNANIISTVSLTTSSNYSYANEEGYTYFKIVAEEPIDLVISTTNNV